MNKSPKEKIDDYTYIFASMSVQTKLTMNIMVPSLVQISAAISDHLVVFPTGDDVLHLR